MTQKGASRVSPLSGADRRRKVKRRPGNIRGWRKSIEEKHQVKKSGKEGIKRKERGKEERGVWAGAVPT